MSLESRVIRACWTCPATSLLQQCLATFCCNNHTRGGLGRWHQQEAATKRQEHLGRYPSQTCHATTQLKPVVQQHSCWTCHATTRSHLPRNNTGCHSTLLNFPVAPSYAACAAQPKPSQNGHAMMPQCTRTKTSSSCTQCPPGTGRADCLLCTHSLLDLALGQCYTARHHKRDFWHFACCIIARHGQHVSRSMSCMVQTSKNLGLSHCRHAQDSRQTWPHIQGKSDTDNNTKAKQRRRSGHGLDSRQAKLQLASSLAHYSTATKQL